MFRDEEQQGDQTWHGSHFSGFAMNSHRLGTESVLALKLALAYVSSR